MQPIMTPDQFRAAIEGELASKIVARINRDGLPPDAAMAGLGDAQAKNYADQYVAECLAGCDNLDGIGSSLKKALKKAGKGVVKVGSAINKPIVKIRVAAKKVALLPVKAVAPKLAKNIEKAVDKAGKAIDDNKKELAAAAVVVAGTIYGGPAVGNALKAGFTKMGGLAALKAGALSVGKTAATAAVASKVLGGNAQAAAKSAAIGAAINTAVNAPASSVTPADNQKAIQIAQTPEFLDTVTQIVKDGIQQNTGYNMESFDAQNLLKASLAYTQKKAVDDLEDQQQKLLEAQMTQQMEQKVSNQLVSPGQTLTPQKTAIEKYGPIAVPLIAVLLSKSF